MDRDEMLTVTVILDRQADIEALDAALAADGATRMERHLRIVNALQGATRGSQEPVLAALQALQDHAKVSAFTPYWILNAIRVTGSRDAILELAGRTDVAAIRPADPFHRIAPVLPGPGHPDRPAEALLRGVGVAPGLTAVRAPEVWHDLGVVGRGALIATIDTGVDGAHPALSQRWRGNCGHPWQTCWLDVQMGNTQSPVDAGDGHGTHVMGTCTGLDSATGDTIGVAWGAEWIAANGVSDQLGQFDSDILACFQWLVDPDGVPSTIDDVPDVIQNSWGVSPIYGYPECHDVWNTVIDNCEAAGIAVLFAAGNRGPDPASIDSPADRADTPFSAFSVGAVDAAGSEWPYPIAWFSSRGPTGCTETPELMVKPEISAPGVQIYSSLPGGLYGEADGTSMAGPHVAGVVALMRSANPDMEVDEIKRILMETARDAGSVGEDNDYGAGVIDAYEAVRRCLNVGYGDLAGTVTNADAGGGPVPFARIHVLENNAAFTADASGRYWGRLMQGTYTIEASHPSFQTVQRGSVVVSPDEETIEDFELDDIVGPVLSDVAEPGWIEDPSAPIPVRVTLQDFSPMPIRELLWKLDGGLWEAVPLEGVGGDRYEGLIPGQPVGTFIRYYMRAVDAGGNSTAFPPGAPDEYRTIHVLPVYFADDAEADKGWTLFENGDATNGRWVRQDPFGTQYQGWWCEPPDDHTEDGVTCFVTGAGNGNGLPGDSDVDAGCVTLTSPTIDLSNAVQPILHYWRWFSLFGAYRDGTFELKASNNGGQSWTTLELLDTNANWWADAAFLLESHLPLTAQMRFRCVVCDTGSPTLVEGALDDFSIIMRDAESAVWQSEILEPPLLERARPSPFSDRTEIRFRLSVPGRVHIRILDAGGREIRSVFSGMVEVGLHSAYWDARDEMDRPAASGVYFCELRAEGHTSYRKLLLLR